MVIDMLKTVRVDVLHRRFGGIAFAHQLQKRQRRAQQRQMRDQAFNAVMTRGINLADEETLNGWLKKNSIDVEKYQIDPTPG